MKCPKCGNEIPEGKLLCEHCGEEVKMVPDFDLEIDAQISETLNSIVKSICEPDQTEEDPLSEEMPDTYDSVGISDLFHKHRLLCSIVFAAFILLLLLFFVIHKVGDYQKNSYDYQYAQAIAMANEKSYREAIDYLDRALAIEQDHLDARILLADYYYLEGNTKSAITILKELAALDSTYQSEIVTKLLTIYLDTEQYEEMGNLLKQCEDADIIEKYSQYAAQDPVFNLEDGVYDEVLSVEMSSITEGFIYYTLDGTTPNKNSMVYEEPLVLESGDYTIKAIFVNMYGVESNLVTKTFYISLSTPKTPDINLISGTYDTPQMIEIYHDANTKVYYTFDGTIPTRNDTRYTEPIEMLFGTSNLSVVAINEDGISSEVVRRTYQLSVQANFNAALALQVLMNQLVVNGTLTDLEGHVPNRLGVNSYDVHSVVNIDQTMYYIVAEKYTDTMDKVHDTNNLYAIDVNTADLYKARKLREGTYYLTSLQ